MSHQNTAADEAARPFFRKTPVVPLMAAICCLLWGSAYPAIKICYRLFSITADDTAGQILIAGIRFFAAGILALTIGSLTRRQLLLPRKSSWGSIIVLCLFQTVIQYIFFYVGLAHADGAKSAIINACSAFVAIGLSTLVFRQEKLTPVKVFGCILGILGVIVVNINFSGFTWDFSLTGEGFILLSAVTYGCSSVFLKRFSAKDDPVMLSGAQFVMGGLILIVIGLAGGGRAVPTSAGALVLLTYMAFLSAAAYSLWGVILKYNPVSRIAVFSFLTPVFGFILSCLFLEDSAASAGLRSVIALILICIGIYIVNRAPQEN